MNIMSGIRSYIMENDTKITIINNKIINVTRCAG